jgi:hypothetical protein
MMMAVSCGVAVVGQAVKTISDTMTMIIGVFTVVSVRRCHCTLSVSDGNRINLEKIAVFPLDVIVCL